MNGDLAALEAHRLIEQDRLDLLRSPGDRNRLGQFATPPTLARAVVGLAAWWMEERGMVPPVRFLDPAVGSGAFWGAAVARFGPAGIGRAVGIEVDPAVAAVARSIWAGERLEVVEADFARLDPPDREDRQFNLIIANPPYVRHHHLARTTKVELVRRVRAELDLPASGLMGLYGFFLLLADAWLARGGVAAWLIPSEFLDVNYGRALRAYLSTRVTLLQIHRFRPTDGQFDAALVTSAVVVFAQAPPPPGHRALFTLGGPLDQPDQGEPVSVADLLAAPKWSRFPGARDRLVPPGSATLGDLFVIKRGIATGANRFFVMTRAEAQARALPPGCLRPILPSPRYLKSSRIEADPAGFPQVDRPLFLLDCRSQTGDSLADAPGLAAYLASGVEQGIHRAYLTSRRTPWYAQERRPPAPFLCSYMARPRPDRPAPLRFFWNQSVATAANGYLLLYPRGPLQDRLTARPELYAALFDHLRAIPPALLSAGGRVYGGGLHKVEPRELAAIPMGDLPGAFLGL